MKQIIYHLWFFIFCTGICSSCTDVQVTTWNPENSKLTISFSTNELDSRTVPGVNSLNENKVSEIACYLYFGNDGQTANANVVRQVSINTDDASTETVFVVSFTDEELADLAKNKTMTLYAIANPPADLPKTGTTNIPTIKKHQLVDTDFSVGEQPETFVMDGQLSIGVSVKANGGLEYSFQNGDVLKLTRSAAKILLHVLANEVKDNGTTWSPITSAMKVSFHNGVKYGYIDAGTDIFLPENKANIAEGSSYYFSPENSIAFNPDAKIKPTGSELEYIQQNSPFYSYPYQWTGVMDTTPYLMLVVPWVKEGDDKNSQNYVYYYYQIPINELQGKCLERNHCYKIFVDIKALGSKVPTEKVTLEPNYIVVEWGDPEDIPVTLKQYRYLVAEQNEYVMNNVNTIDIPFITSHECELAEVIVKINDLRHEVVEERSMKGSLTSNNKTYNATRNSNMITRKLNGESLNTTYPMLVNDMTITLNDENSTININHILDNKWSNTDKEYDYCPIHITIKLWHKSDHNYVETIKVTQYPMMYVEAEKNEGGNNVKKDLSWEHPYDYFTSLWPSNTTNYDRGWVFVNENNKYIYEDWRMVRGCYNGNGSVNKNPNMYIITVTALDEGSPYILGDPRTGTRLKDTELFTDEAWNTNDAAAMYAVADGKERDLTYYNPTRTDNESENIIAPKFRMGSSYSKLLYEIALPPHRDMFKRCATYQEQGYPAGRWRLPTVAELKFVQQLSIEKKIPHLFQGNNQYCAATGVYKYVFDENNPNIPGTIEKLNTNVGVVRPFYDDWYWGDDKCDPKVFTWGDKPL